MGEPSAAPPNVTDYYHGRMRFISDARQWLHFLGRLRQPAEPQRPYTHMIQAAYADYMTQERDLSPHTIRGHCWVLDQFLSRFWQQQHPFQCRSASASSYISIL